MHFEGGSFEDAVNEGVRRGYTEGFLRKSVVGDPILRENTKDNTPAVIHTRIVEGDRVKITVAPKGFGSENMSRVFMLKPAEGLEGVKNAILTAVKDAGPNACPPLVVGVGIGGTFEKCALMAKKALTREVGKHSDIPYVRKLEEEMLEKINCLGIGPGGLGGTVTALAVNVNTYPTHIAGLPVAVNIMLPCEQAYSLCFVKTADKIAAVEKAEVKGNRNGSTYFSACRQRDGRRTKGRRLCIYYRHDITQRVMLRISGCTKRFVREETYLLI